MRVENMTSSKGNKIANQFIISLPGPNNFMDGTVTGSGLAFQSYDSVIAFREYTGKVYLDKKTWNYSLTTGKYRNIFLNETKKETEAKIKNGEYILVDLN